MTLINLYFAVEYNPVETTLMEVIRLWPCIR